MKWRETVKEIAPYVPGKSIELVKEELGLDEVIRLASNENPLGPSQKALDAMQVALPDAHLYPDAPATELRVRLASLYGVDADQIITGNGADNIISVLISAYVDEGDEVLYGSPTFPAYRSSTLLMGGTPVEVPLTDDFTFDLEGLKAKVTDKTKLIFICNPNNPTGTVVDSDALENFVKGLPDHVRVVLDEAYIEYVEQEDYTTGIDLFKKGYPVITMRTFSKYYGLAGLRVGYAIAHQDVLEPMLRLREPFAVNRLAIIAALATLDDEDYMALHAKMNREGKAYLTAELEKLGFLVYPSQSNFLFVDLKRKSDDIFDGLLEKGFIIRPCNSWGYDQHVRISIGTQEQNEGLMKALQAVM